MLGDGRAGDQCPKSWCGRGACIHPPRRRAGSGPPQGSDSTPKRRDQNATLLAATRALAALDEREARAALAAVRLDAATVQRPAATLSPGERTRAELALLAHHGAACLLLDEPTNHLDLHALNVLEAALEGWRGGLVVATHDERSRAALGLDRTVEL